MGSEAANVPLVHFHRNRQSATLIQPDQNSIFGSRAGGSVLAKIEISSAD